jgi:hypothetical protein
MKDKRILIMLLAVALLLPALNVFAGVLVRYNLFHGSQCQAPQGTVTYSVLGARATTDTGFVCPASWSLDANATTPAQPMQKFWFKAFWTDAGLAAPTCTMIVDSTYGGLTIVGSSHATVDPTNPSNMSVGAAGQTGQTGIVVDIRRAYMKCTGVVNNAGIDGYSLTTCVGSSGSDCPSP